MIKEQPPYDGPLLKARRELGQINHLTGLPDWARSSSDDAANDFEEFTLTEAVALLATGDVAIVSGLRDYEIHLRASGHPEPAQASWFMIDRDAAHYHAGTEKVDGWVYEAAEVLRQACEHAAVSVRGTPAAQSTPVLIPPLDFKGGIIGPGLDGRLSSVGSSHQLRYHSLRFCAAHVRALSGLASNHRSTQPAKQTSKPLRKPGPKKGPGYNLRGVPRYELMHSLVKDQGKAVATAAREVLTEEGLREHQITTGVGRLRVGYTKWEEVNDR